MNVLKSRKKFILIALMLCIVLWYSFAQDDQDRIKPLQELIDPTETMILSTTEIIVKFNDIQMDVHSLLPDALKSRNSGTNPFVKQLVKTIGKKETRNSNKRLENLESRLQQIYSVHVPETTTIEALLEEFRAMPSVEYARPKYIYETCYVPQDQRYNEQWAHQITGAEAAWDIETGDGSVIVAVIDSGVDYTHPDLSANIWHDPQGNPGKDFVDINVQEYISMGYQTIGYEDYTIVDNDPNDKMGHGTHCAGIIGARHNSIGIAGVSNGSKIMPLRASFALNKYGAVRGLFDETAIVDAVLYAVANNADIISMSFGGMYESEPITDVLHYAYENGVTLIAAAGNSNSKMHEYYPAGLDVVISVASTTQDDSRSLFSNFGTWVDIAAPGENILSTVPTMAALGDPSGYAVSSGTSMACPYVAGAAALLLSRDATLTPNEIKQMLKAGVDSFASTNTEYFGTGRINLYKLMQANTSVIPSVSIGYPMHNRIVSDINLAITGSAVGSGYIVEMAASPYADTWQLIGSGTSVVDGTLATLTTQYPRGDKAYIKVTGYMGSSTVTDMAEVLLFDVFAGWPKNTFSVANASPKVYDINGDGQKETIIPVQYVMNTNLNGYLFVLNPDGSLLWAKELDLPLIGTPAIGDMDDDGVIEIVVSGYSGIYAFNADGTTQEGSWPKAHNTFNIPILADMDNDGDLEVAVGASEDAGIQAGPVKNVYVWHHDGTPVTGWPQEIIDVTNMACADLDKDGTMELLVSQQYTKGSQLYIFNHDGTSFSVNWPKAIKGSLRNAPLVGDIDCDGEYEIFAITTVEANLWEIDGTVGVGNWPMTGLNIASDAMRDIPILANFDDDMALEIIFRTNKGVYPDSWHVVNHDGTYVPGWPITMPYKPSTVNWDFQPIVLDIDYDGQMEIVAQTAEKMLVLGENGFEKSAYSRPLTPETWTSSLNSYPVADDIDNDGMLEIVCMTSHGIIEKFDYSAPYFPHTIEWGSYRYDAGNTGWYKIKSTCIVQMVIDEDWGTGFRGYVNIKNISSETIEGWTMEFEWDRYISIIWDAVLLSNVNGEFKILNAGWNCDIEPGMQAQFGFVGYSGNVTQEAVNYTVNGIPAIVID